MKENKNTQEKSAVCAKITQDQHDKILKMLSDGMHVESMLVYLDITEKDLRRKLDRNMPYSYDGLFANAIAKGSALYKKKWLEKAEESAKEEGKMHEWSKYVLKHTGGMSSSIREEEPLNIVYDSADPEKTVNKIIQTYADGEVSLEKARGLVELITQSYAIKEIEQEKETSTTHNLDCRVGN